MVIDITIVNEQHHLRLKGKELQVDISLNAIFHCPNPQLHSALIKAIGAASGIYPVQASTSASARRAHYLEAPAKFIINVPSARMQKLLGEHFATLAVVVNDREQAANVAANVFREQGFEAKVHTHAEPEFPEGLLVFVEVPALKGILLLFWPTPETVMQLPEETRKSLPVREAWDAAKHLI